MAQILDGRETAAEIGAEVSEGVKELEAEGHAVRDVVLVGEDPASMTYVRNKQNDCAEVGIKSQAHRYAEDVTQEELIELVERLNEDTSVSGFFIQLPLPDNLDSQILLSRTAPDKDVDGLSPMSAGRLAVGLPTLLPCNPARDRPAPGTLRHRAGGQRGGDFGAFQLSRQAGGPASVARERHCNCLPLAHAESGCGRRPGGYPNRSPRQPRGDRGGLRQRGGRW
jgi:hypothetical protein